MGAIEKTTKKDPKGKRARNPLWKVTSEIVTKRTIDAIKQRERKKAKDSRRVEETKAQYLYS